LIKPAYDEAGWADTMNDNLDAIDAAIATSIFFTGYRGAWLLNTLYRVNDVAVDAVLNEIYLCAVEHTSPGTGTFLAARTATPANWATLTTSAAYAAAARVSSQLAQAAEVSATTQATNALIQAGAALTQAINAQSFASASAASAAGSAGSAVISANFAVISAATRAMEQAILAAMPVTAAVATDDFTLTIPAAYVQAIYQRTTVAYDGGTVNLTIGTTVGGADVVAATDIKAIGLRTLTLVDAIAPTLSPSLGLLLHIRITRTASFAGAAGAGVVIAKLLVPA